MLKSLDRKLAEIHADANSRAFILADAKDADMAFGAAAPGKSPESYSGQTRFRSLEEWREIIRQIVRQELVDIMLISASNNEVLTIRERIFDGSPVTPAVRANDTTDIHVARGAVYPKQPSLPFRTASIDHIQRGRLANDQDAAEDRIMGANLGLYSITFNNDAQLDRHALEEYARFRIEAERKGFRHFLEIFDPNSPRTPVPPELLGGFINDLIVRTLAGVAEAGRPVFLKMVYHGPRFMEELVRYDRHLVPGILGGSAGTTYDAFKLLYDAKKYGARVALFGRKINNAEHQLSFVQFLRMIADGEIEPEEAVKAYHGVLQHLGIKPARSLRDDLVQTEGASSYGGGRAVSMPSRGAVQSAASGRFAPAQKALHAAKPQAAGENKTAAGQPAGQTAVGRGAVGRALPASVPGEAGRAGLPASAPTHVDYPKKENGLPDFAKMTSEQRLAYHRARLNGQA